MFPREFREENRENLPRKMLELAQFLLLLFFFFFFFFFFFVFFFFFFLNKSSVLGA